MFKEIKSRISPVICLLSAILTISAIQIAHADNSPLQGNVEEGDVAPSKGIIEKDIEPMPTPVMSPPKLSPQKATIDQNKLQGGAQDNGLKGTVDESGGGGLKSQVGKEAPNKDVLQGAATKEQSRPGDSIDPDADDQELMVDWDKWHNKFLWAVQSGVDEELNNSGGADLRWDENKKTMVHKIPVGAAVWFSCQVTPDKQIVNLKLEKSSGYQNFDKAVINSISMLSGSSILRYPARSKRKIVRQAAGIETSTTGERKYFKFGDVERRMVPGN